MTNFAVFIGEPLNFKDKLWVYPPKVKDVLTNPNFSFYVHILTTSDDDVKYELKKANGEMEKYPTAFEFLLGNCFYDEKVRELTINAFEFFCRVNAEFDYENKRVLLYDSSSELRYLEENEFFDFQNVVRNALGDKELAPPEPEDPNENPRIRAMKEKARERDRIKAKKQKGGISLETCLTAICCMGLGINPLNIGEMSYAAVGPIMRMMSEKEKYDIDIRSLLAGADSKKVKPKHWIRNLND